MTIICHLLGHLLDYSSYFRFTKLIVTCWPHPAFSWSGTAGPCPTCPATAGSLTAAQQTHSRWPRRPPAGRTGCLPPAAQGPGTSAWPRSRCSSHMVQLKAEWTVRSKLDELVVRTWCIQIHRFYCIYQWQKNTNMSFSKIFKFISLGKITLFTPFFKWTIFKSIVFFKHFTVSECYYQIQKLHVQNFFKIWPYLLKAISLFPNMLFSSLLG